MKKILLLCAAFASAGPLAAEKLDHGPVTSLRSVMLRDGHIYIPVGYPRNNVPFQAVLSELWNSQKAGQKRPDSYGQPWARFGVESLEPIFGSIPTEFLVLIPQYIPGQSLGPCDEKEQCAPNTESFQSAVLEVQGAALFRWGCDDQTIVPVLDLGEWRWGRTGEWPSATALSLTAGKKTEIASLEPEALPAEWRAEVPQYYKGAVVSQPARDQKAFLIYFKDGTGGDNFLILQAGKEGVQKLLENGPFDISC